MTELEKALENALLEYVVRYGLTQKARAVLSRPQNEHIGLELQRTKATSNEEVVSKPNQTMVSRQPSKK